MEKGWVEQVKGDQKGRCRHLLSQLVTTPTPLCGWGGCADYALNPSSIVVNVIVTLLKVWCEIAKIMFHYHFQSTPMQIAVSTDLKFWIEAFESQYIWQFIFALWAKGVFCGKKRVIQLDWRHLCEGAGEAVSPGHNGTRLHFTQNPLEATSRVLVHVHKHCRQCLFVFAVTREYDCDLLWRFEEV